MPHFLGLFRTFSALPCHAASNDCDGVHARVNECESESESESESERMSECVLCKGGGLQGHSALPLCASLASFSFSFFFLFAHVRS